MQLTKTDLFPKMKFCGHALSTSTKLVCRRYKFKQSYFSRLYFLQLIKLNLHEHVYQSCMKQLHERFNVQHDVK